MKKVINILAYIGLMLATLALGAVLLPVGFVFSLIRLIKRFREYLFGILLSIDQLGNTVCVELFNVCLITGKSNNLFGNPDETISSVLGKNKLAGTLTGCGRGLCWLLNSVQKNHVENSIENVLSDK